LLMLLNKRTPVNEFDVTGPYDFPDSLMPLQEFQNIALNSRPDLNAAKQSVPLASLTYSLAVANGSTDPTYSLFYSQNPSFNNPNAFNTLGASVSIPLRISIRIRAKKPEPW
jgi:outer membrane protein, heavy metal efflux system